MRGMPKPGFRQSSTRGTSPHRYWRLWGQILMKSEWVDRDVRATIDRYGQQGFGADLAQRIYTTRLLGRERSLVLHGGGNTSVKIVMNDLLGEQVEVLCVKGSG